MRRMWMALAFVVSACGAPPPDPDYYACTEAQSQQSWAFCLCDSQGGALVGGMAMCLPNPPDRPTSTGYAWSRCGLCGYDLSSPCRNLNYSSGGCPSGMVCNRDFANPHCITNAAATASAVHAQ